ncbi:MAG TPA: SRPBCC domain-containing protein [Solirubrobacteraceae bacterium]|nr:SRPBCC domain-containing protein [Solirubrobacteraceae bacterium]
MSSTRTTRQVRAPRAAVYRALLDPDAVAVWRVPVGMSAVVHEFDPREGGRFRVSLAYDDPLRGGKTEGYTDTYHGHFATLVADAQVVEVIEFETEDPQLQGEMTITTTLVERAGATEVSIEHEGLPAGVSPADNETGTRMALDKLADLFDPDH